MKTESRNVNPPPYRHERGYLHWIVLGLFGAWPFLSFLNHNQDDALVYWTAIAIYGVAFVGFLFALALLGRLLLGHNRSRPIAITLGVGAICLFNYLTIAAPLSDLGISLGSVKIAIWLAISLVITAAAWWLSAKPNAAVAIFAAAAVMVSVPTVQLALFAIEATQSDSHQGTAVAKTVRNSSQPNVYWIVLDAYTRGDVLEAYFDYRNDAFLSALRKRRFFVADKAYSNYASTKLSLSTTWNMDYYLPVGDPMHPSLWSARLRGYSRVVDRFLAKGYRYVHAEPGGNNRKTGCGGREVLCITSKSSGVLGLDEAEVALLKLTAVFPIALRLFPKLLSFDFTDLDDVSEKLVIQPGQPLFAFIHILSPHPPARYKRDCSRVEQVAFSLVGGETDTPKSYLTDLKCLNPEVIAFVDRILADDPGDPIIVIQSDHGYRGDENTLPSPTIEAIDRRLIRFAILQAMRLPERCGSLLRDDISLVNTFRLVFTCLGDTDVPPTVVDRMFAHSKTTTRPLVID